MNHLIDWKLFKSIHKKLGRGKEADVPLPWPKLGSFLKNGIDSVAVILKDFLYIVETSLNKLEFGVL